VIYENLSNHSRRNHKPICKKQEGNSIGNTLERIQTLIDEIYAKEMAVIRGKPLWDLFDGPMRSALRYQAKERAKRKALRMVESDSKLIDKG
jgi:hypothetical protein